jgi:hypothetical protein
MGRRIAFILIGVLAIALQARGAYERLDPHGDPKLNLKSVRSLQGRNACTTCHTEVKGKIVVKGNPDLICTTCHNKLPHSGAIEHMGKTREVNGKQETIRCSSCHGYHRADQIEVTGKSGVIPGQFFSGAKQPAVTPDLKIKTNSNAMLRRTCVECHAY